MSEERERSLSAEEIDRIIREIVENPNISRKEIDEKAGISSRGKGREEILLKPWIRDNTGLVFGEQIYWRYEKLRSMRNTSITPDLVGTDSQGQPVIVEVKFKFEFQGDSNHIRTDPEKMSIGQILLYACAYRRKYPSTQILRLFVISIDFSPDVECVCKFLSSKGINIDHISIEKILSEK
jgi:hypothetical protein